MHFNVPYTHIRADAHNDNLKAPWNYNNKGIYIGNASCLESRNPSLGMLNRL